MDKKEKIKRSFLIIVIMIIAIVSTISARERRIRKNKEKEKNQSSEVVADYNINIIKESFNVNNNENYLISPYNIEIALNMLREGAIDKTKEEIDRVIGNRKINDVSIPGKLNIANAIFIKDKYKDDVKKDFISILDNKYKSEVLYDSFDSADVINKWAKEKTNGMIEKVIDDIDQSFVMGLASALALDVEWTNQFECNKTVSEEFIKSDGKKINTEMMRNTYSSSAKYLKTDDVEGIVIPYKMDSDDIELEFVAILPKTSVNDYISNLTKEKLDNLFVDLTEATAKYHINLSLPRFSYSYEIEKFIDVLKKMGIEEAFDPENANFKNMIDISENVYVGDAIHKTRIELNEKGTKAAAVTFFGTKANGMITGDYDEVDIKFNKPFVYMIREKNTGEILFFGTVFEPNIWKGSTCSN